LFHSDRVAGAAVEKEARAVLVVYWS
jgi:hypothetical protein